MRVLFTNVIYLRSLMLACYFILSLIARFLSDFFHVTLSIAEMSSGFSVQCGCTSFVGSIYFIFVLC